MNDLNLRAARIQLYGLLAAVLLSIVIAIGITTGAFVLSFSVLRDLASQGLMPAEYAWIFPAIVDGAILGSTIAAVVLSKIGGSAAGKKFFVCLLVLVVCISVVGNAYHAHEAAIEAAAKVAAGIDLGFTPLSPVAASLIAVIPPLLVLAFTHGIGILIKAIGAAYSEYNALVNVPAVDTHVAATASESAGDIRGVVAPVAVVVPKSDPEPGEGAVAEWAIETDGPAMDPHADTDVAPAVAHIADTAPVEVELREVIAESVAAPVAGVQADAPKEGPEQTVEALLAFIDQVPGLDEAVRETARLKIADGLSFAAIAEKTDAKAPSTAMRRYRKAERVASNAGFTIPPLPTLARMSSISTTTPAEMRRWPW
ncbi:DUF2637 domain-containing protein [Rhodococcus hoagii]|nr:DUF2637 domain-containing protein [Prescottella equi]